MKNYNFGGGILMLFKKLFGPKKYDKCGDLMVDEVPMIYGSSQSHRSRWACPKCNPRKPIPTTSLYKGGK